MEAEAVNAVTNGGSDLLFILVGFVIAFQVIDLLTRLFARMDTRERERSISATLKAIEAQVDELHQWHNVLDDDGVRVWYTRKLENKAQRIIDLLEQLVRNNK